MAGKIKVIISFTPRLEGQLAIGVVAGTPAATIKHPCRTQVAIQIILDLPVRRNLRHPPAVAVDVFRQQVAGTVVFSNRISLHIADVVNFIVISRYVEPEIVYITAYNNYQSII